MNLINLKLLINSKMNNNFNCNLILHKWNLITKQKMASLPCIMEILENLLIILIKKIDMIFADPPYFLSKNKSICINGSWKSFEKGAWDRLTSQENINEFNRSWLSTCRNILKEDGTIFVTGTYHNIFSVASCMVELGYKILNIIVWQKSDAKPTLSRNYFNFTTEYIVWARKNDNIPHFFNCDLMEQLNGGVRMSDVWRIPFLSSWELKCGKHPTQKPLRLLYRIILASTHEGDTILDPFAGSCTTGIAANLLNRKFIGIDQDIDYLSYGIRRKHEIEDTNIANIIRKKMAENPEEVMVIVNHCRKELREKMIETGICYLRAGNSKVLFVSLLDLNACNMYYYIQEETILNYLNSNQKVVFKYGQKKRLKNMGLNHHMLPTILCCILIILSL